MNTYGLDSFVNSIDPESLVLLFYLLIMVIQVLATIIFVSIEFILTGIALYNMAFRAGYNYPFIAFIPFARKYLMHMLPIKEYSLVGMYKTYNRAEGFVIYMLICYAAPIVIQSIMSVISIIPIIGWLIVSVGSLIMTAVYIFMGISTAVMRIDLYELYLKESKGAAIALGIISLFVPLMSPIVLLILCKREPEFGFGNYYKPVFAQTDEE